MEPSEVYLDEIFLSLQGEAGETGAPQLFLRLGGCPLRCHYCDTPRSWKRQPVYRSYRADECLELPNPLDADGLHAELLTVATSYRVLPHELTLAITGGEPLEQAEFLLEWLPTWPGRVLLETAGIWPDRLEQMLPHVDVLSLDWKLASTLRAGADLVAAADCAHWLSTSGLEGWVKVVVGDDMTTTELESGLRQLAESAPGVRTYLQPVTPVSGGPGTPPSDRLLDWSLRFRHLPLDLRVQPQMHPAMGLR